jgi:hypothetical protein
MFFVNQAIHRIRRQGWALLPYTLGRFYAIRRLYSLQSRILYGRQKQEVANTIFSGVNAEQAVSNLQTRAVYLPVSLPATIVSELREIAQSAQLEARTDDVKHFFHYADVKNARLPTGELVLMGKVVDVLQFPIVSLVASDPLALDVMSAYLGYTPKNREIRIFWSFASDAGLDVRIRAGQTTRFHFDVHAYNFVYAAYYLLDCDRRNGAHVMITGSHRDKPIKWLLGSANQTEDAIYSHYSKGRTLTIEGKAGSGFWQDSSCYHKALPPETSDRLVFQVRYF